MHLYVTLCPFPGRGPTKFGFPTLRLMSESISPRHPCNFHSSAPPSGLRRKEDHPFVGTDRPLSVLSAHKPPPIPLRREVRWTVGAAACAPPYYPSSAPPCLALSSFLLEKTSVPLRALIQYTQYCAAVFEHLETTTDGSEEDSLTLPRLLPRGLPTTLKLPSSKNSTRHRKHRETAVIMADRTHS